MPVVFWFWSLLKEAERRGVGVVFLLLLALCDVLDNVSVVLMIQRNFPSYLLLERRHLSSIRLECLQSELNANANGVLTFSQQLGC